MISCDEHLFDHGTDSSVAVWPEVEGGQIVVETEMKQGMIKAKKMNDGQLNVQQL